MYSYPCIRCSCSALRPQTVQFVCVPCFDLCRIDPSNNKISLLSRPWSEDLKLLSLRWLFSDFTPFLMPAEPHLTRIFTWFGSRHFECYVTKLVPGPYQLFLPNQTTRTPSSFDIKKERKSNHLKTWGAYHLTEKSVRLVESIIISNIPVYRRIAISVTVWIQKKGEFV